MVAFVEHLTLNKIVHIHAFKYPVLQFLVRIIRFFIIPAIIFILLIILLMITIYIKLFVLIFLEFALLVRLQINIEIIQLA
jgi:hypothetical protein